MLRVLLTNDDGIQAPGLRALAACLAQRCELLVVAPDQPSGATSHSITLHKPLRLERAIDFPACGGDFPRLTAYACSGTPTDCVMLGVLHLAKDNPPHLVLSGINNGENVAQDLSYSGTVGGALEGAACGVPSIAISQVATEKLSYLDAAAGMDLLMALLLYGRAFEHHSRLLESWRSQPGRDNGILWELPEKATGKLAAGGMYPDPAGWPPPALAVTPCLNVNFPDMPLLELQGVRWTVAGRRVYSEVVREVMDPRGRPYYWIAGEKSVHEDGRKGTDTAALADGYVSVTPISYDLTSTTDLATLSRWVAQQVQH